MNKNYIIYLKEWYGYNRYGKNCKQPMEVYVDIFEIDIFEFQKSIKTSDITILETMNFSNKTLISKTEKIKNEYKIIEQYLYYDNEDEAQKKYEELRFYADDNNDEPYYLRN